MDHGQVFKDLNYIRLERACTAYERCELNLSGAAHYTGIGVERMMRELTRWGIDHGPSTEQFVDGLETLADLFGIRSGSGNRRTVVFRDVDADSALPGSRLANANVNHIMLLSALSVYLGEVRL